jgi:Big-like domain-containing protein
MNRFRQPRGPGRSGRFTLLLGAVVAAGLMVSVGDATVWTLTLNSPTTASPATLTSLPGTVPVGFSYRTGSYGTTTGQVKIQSGGSDCATGTVIAQSESTTLATTNNSTLTSSIDVSVPDTTPNGSYRVCLTVTNPGYPYPTGDLSLTRSQEAAVTVSSSLSEGFDDISTLDASGWFMQSNSDYTGSWYQGNTGTSGTTGYPGFQFDAQSGAANSYIATDYGPGVGAMVSNWLVTPPLTLQAGATFSFYTRAVGGIWPDRLQVRLSLNGTSTNVGSTATDVGDFTTLVEDINPSYTRDGYPQSWTQYTITIATADVSTPTLGRIAFQYFLPNNNDYGTYIGIDTAGYQPGGELPSPPTVSFSGVALSADTGSSSSDFVTKTAAQTISATLSGAPAAGDVVYGSLNGGTTWTDITSKVTGTSLSWDGVTLTGSGTLKLKVSNSGGDGPVFSHAYVLDTTAPTITILSAAFSNDTGLSSSDLVTKTAAQTISGTLSATLTGDGVQVSLDNGTTWTAATAGIGSSSWSLAAQTLTGSNTLQAKVSDTAGNDGPVYSHSYVLDTTAPTITFSNLAFSADTGSSSSDFVTNTAAQTITATLSSMLGTSSPLIAGPLIAITGDSANGSLDNGATWTNITGKVSGTALSWGVTLSGSDTVKLKVTDLAGNDGTVFSQAYVLDTTAPTVTNVSSSTADGIYGTGAVISIQVTFNDAVTVSGTPQLTLETGTTPGHTANYASGSGTGTLTFSYTVQAGDTSTDLDYASTTALALNGGTIKDAAGNDATVTLATPGTTGSLAANKAIVINTADTTAPDTFIDNTPTNPTTSTDASFTYHSDDVTATFECKLDSGSFTACPSSGASYSGLAVGSHTFSVRAVDASLNVDQTPASFTWQVTTAPPSGDTLTATNGDPVNGSEGQALSRLRLGTFTDSNKVAVASDFTATINWGDGSNSENATVTGRRGNFTATGSHTFTTPGTYTVVTTISATNANEVTTQTTITVGQSALKAGTVRVTIDKGSSTATLVATFTDPNPLDAGVYSATIDWGDSSTSTPAVTSDGRSFSLTDTHLYATSGTYNITITITHPDGSPLEMKGIARIR